ncbi:MAG: DUF924 family protein [Rhizobacter sp.]
MSLPSGEAREVLDFWFGTEGATRDEWFRKDAAFDAVIRERFGALVERALAGELVDWGGAPASALARVLLLDQFTRNAFRDSPRAFAGDAQALAAARAMVAAGHDMALPPVQRSFVYLPFEHAEDLAAQDEGVKLFAALAAESPAQADYLDYARRHRDIVARFARFPHRNAVLQRVSTPEEIEFLRQPGSSF